MIIPAPLRVNIEICNSGKIPQCPKNRLDNSRFAHRLHTIMCVTFSNRDEAGKIEDTTQFAPKYDSDGLMVAVAIDHQTKEPLMLAYMNEESLKLTLEKQEAVYYSRSRQEIWHKGATSGHVQKIKEIRTDCDQDALILVVEQLGAGACHTGKQSCFYRTVTVEDGAAVTKMADGVEQTFDPEAVYGKK